MFLGFKLPIWFCVLRFGKIKENTKIWEICFGSSFLSFTKSFPKYFSLSFVFQTLGFSHLSYIIYPILYDLYLWENLVCGLCNHLVVNPFSLWLSLFGRGWFGLWGAPSLVEVEVVVYSLLVRWSWNWLVSLFGRGGLCLYNLGRGCWLREEFGTPGCCTNPPRWRFPRWESSVDKLVDWKSFSVKAGT